MQQLLLDIKKIRQLIGADNIKRIKKLEIKDQIDSTNNYLMHLVSKNFKGVAICLAEQQSKGRGRMGRKWVSPFGANLYLSILWPFNKDVGDLAGLSLAVGVIIADALNSLQIKNVQLKWPNDVLYQNKKLGGVLIDVASEANGMSFVVIGIGININMPKAVGRRIDQPWTDLRSILRQELDRNIVAGALINSLLEKLPQFEMDGLGGFIQQWKKRDALLNQKVELQLQNRKIIGIAKGIDKLGHLLVEEQSGEILAFSSGDVAFC